MATLDMNRQVAQEMKHQLLMHARLERLAQVIGRLEAELGLQSGPAPQGVGRLASELARELESHSPSRRFADLSARLRSDLANRTDEQVDAELADLEAVVVHNEQELLNRYGDTLPQDREDSGPAGVFRFWVNYAIVKKRWQAECEPELKRLLSAASLLPVVSALREANVDASLAIEKVQSHLHGSYRKWIDGKLGDVHKVLKYNNRVLAEFAPESIGNCDRYTRRIDRLREGLRSPVPNWPPLAFGFLLNRLLDDVELTQTGQRICDEILGHIGDGDNEAEEDLRVQFLVSVVRAFDAMHEQEPLPATAWELLNGFGGRLFKEQEKRVEILHPTEVDDDDGRYEHMFHNPQQPLRVLETGLILRGAQGEQQVIRGRISAPCKVPPIYERLIDLEAATPPHRQSLRRACSNLRERLEDANATDLRILLGDDADGEIRERLSAVLHNLHLTQTLSPRNQISEPEAHALAELRHALEAEGVQIRPATVEELDADLRWRMYGNVGDVGTSGVRAIRIDWGDDTHQTDMVLGAPQGGALLQGFLESADELMQLQCEDPGWEGWMGVNQVLGDLCRPGMVAFDEQSLQTHAWELFQSFLKQSREVEERLSGRYLHFAGVFFQAFERHGGDVVPRWDVDAKWFAPLTPDNVSRFDVTWTNSDRPPGAISHVRQFGFGDHRAVVEASSGGANAAVYLNLEYPDFAQDAPALIALHAFLQTLPFRDPSTMDEELRRRFKLLKSDLGGKSKKWLNRWVHELLDGTASEIARDWFIVVAQWIKVLPHVDTRQGAVTWPADVSTVGPEIDYVPSDLPVDTVLDGPPWANTTFATTLNDCAVSLSLGGSADSLLARCSDGWREIRNVIPEEEEKELRTLSGTLLLQLRDMDRGIPLGPNKTVAQRFQEVLQSLLERVQENEAARGNYDQVLTVLAEIARCAGVQITPDRWKWSEPVTWQEHWGDAKARFSRAPIGKVELRAFGLKDDLKVWSKCAATLSAGEAPPGYDKLRDLQRQLGQNSENGISANLEKFFKTLNGLPGCCFKSHQDEAAHGDCILKIIKALHLTLYDEILSAHPGLRKHMEKELRQLSEHFGLSAYPGTATQFMSDFKPDVEHWFDYDCGVSLANSTRQVGNSRKRGCIDEVLRPGLVRRGQSRPDVIAKVRLRPLNNV